MHEATKGTGIRPQRNKLTRSDTVHLGAVDLDQQNFAMN